METKEYVFENENHTLAVMLQSQLLKDNDVIFAGFIQDHPLENKFELKVTSKNPGLSMKNAFSSLKKELERIKNLL